MKQKQTLYCQMKNHDNFGFPATVTGNAYVHADQIGILGVAYDEKNQCIKQSNILKNTDAFINDPETIVKNINQLIDGKLVPTTFYLAPYKTENCTWDKPTIHEVPHNCEVTLEIILAEDDELIRTFLYKTKNKNCSVFELIQNLIESDIDELGPKCLINEDKLFTYTKTDDFEETGYLVDYYSPIGEKINVCYKRTSEILDHMISARIINISKK